MKAELYIQPDFVYGITIPELDEEKNVNSDVELYVNIGIVGADSTELNALIFDYQEQYNKIFLSSAGQHVSRAAMFKLCDSLQILCDKRYRHVKNDYFRNYVHYSIASINASLSRGERFLMNMYISQKPIRYSQAAYMDFFNSYFKGYLARIASQRKGQSLYNIINTRADYATLLNFVRFEKELRSDSLRELIIMRELWDYHFSADFAPEAIEQIISQLNTQTKIKEHQKISADMLAYFNRLQVGAQAPVFTAVARDKKKISLSSFKGRWVYLNFFSTKNTETLKEMPKIASLKRKFADKMVFISVCLDDSLSAYQSYLRANPKFDWAILHNPDPSFTKTAKQLYYVTGTEGYFLIDNFGHLSASPALSPSKGIEYRLNVIFKVKTKQTKTGIR